MQDTKTDEEEEIEEEEIDSDDDEFCHDEDGDC